MQNRELPAFFTEAAQLREEERERRSIFGTEPTDERGPIGNFFRDVGPIFVGLFSFLVSYGLLLTFGLLALLVLMLGFASFSVPTTPYVGPTNVTTAKDALDHARTAIRIMAGSAAFLALWPGWFGASVARRHFEATR